MKTWDGGSNRTLFVALLMAGWCTGWLWLLLATTRSLPGVITNLPGRGSLELLEILTGRTYPIVLLCVFLLAMLPPLLLGSLRDVCDPRAHARDALRWPLRAKWFLWPAIAWSFGGAALAFWLHNRSGSELVFMAIATLASIAGPFVCLNPSTLDADVPEHWWQLSWPGRKAFWQCLLLWLCYALASFLMTALATISNALESTGLELLDVLLSAYLVVVAAALWLNRGRRSETRADLGRLWRNGFVAEFVWQGLVCGLVFAVLAFPLVICMLQMVFVIPQYDEWARHLGKVVPKGLVMQGQLSRASDSLLAVASVPIGLFSWLVLGRLMRQHGTGMRLR